METYATHSILAKTQQKTEADWIGLDSARFDVPCTRHILGHFGDGGVTAASARIVAAVRSGLEHGP